MALDLDDFLVSRGANEAEIAQAEAEGWLPVLVVERLLFPGVRRYRGDDVAALAGVDRDLPDEMWRAMGFPDVAPDDRAFTDADVVALREATKIETWRQGLEATMQRVRVVNAAMARVAETWSDVVQHEIEAVAATGASQRDVAAAIAEQLNPDRALFLFEYVLRRQMVAAVRRRFQWSAFEEDAVPLAVAFVDLVGFTSLSQQVSAQELAAIVAHFEAIVFDSVATHTGRVVKTIGDEVMFVADEPAAAATIALDVSDAHRESETLPDVRVGIAHGPVIPLEGDFFGLTVNRASRVVSVARRGTIVVDEQVHDALAANDRYAFRSLGRRPIKDLGWIRLWALRRGTAAA